MPGKEINATVTREQGRVVVTIDETDQAKAGIAGLICELTAAPAVSAAPGSEKQEEELSCAQEPRVKERSYIHEPGPEELDEDLRHAQELRKEKRRFIRALEVEEAHKGDSFPIERRAELDRCREELNILEKRIHDLEAQRREMHFANIPADEGFPYATKQQTGRL